MKLPRCAWMLVGVLAVAGGCAARDGDPPPAPALRSAEPIGVQMMRVVPELRGQRFSNLLTFESSDDLVFLTVTDARPPRIDTGRAHTGRSSAHVSGGSFGVKLSSVVGPGAFPGEWKLVGAYLYADEPAQLTISCLIGGALVAQRQIPLPAGRWTPAMIDVTLLSQMKMLIEPQATAVISFACDRAVSLWCDDFMLIDNEQTLVGGDSVAASAWTIRRRGLNFFGDVPQRFSFKLLSAEGGPEGWRIEEVNEKRARFSSDGPQRMLTIYNDGRAYYDGEYRPLSATAAEPPLVQQHRSPGRVELAPEQGRPDRNSPGDGDNDGYNEARGTYAIRAAGSRLELSIIPRGVPLVHPVLEITGLPPGEVLAALEGRLVQDITRTEDGTVLIELPFTLSRAATLSVRLQ